MTQEQMEHLSYIRTYEGYCIRTILIMWDFCHLSWQETIAHVGIRFSYSFQPFLLLDMFDCWSLAVAFSKLHRW